MNESQSLAGQIGRASAIIIIWSLLDKILAVAKEMLTAHRFGVSADLDVFNITYSFPGTIILLFSGTLSAALVPLYLEWRARSPREADSHASWLIYLMAIFFTGLALVCFVFAPEIIALIGYGFSPEQKRTAVVMERFLTLLIFLDGAGIVFMGLLLARKQFFHLYVAPIFINVTIIFLLIYDFGLDVYALVWGFLIGTTLKTLYMGIILRKRGFQYGASLPFDRQIVKTVWLLAMPMLGSQLIANSNLFIDHVMATLLPAGSVSTLRYAFRINDLPVQVVIAAISRAIFPFISEEQAAGRRENLQNIFKYSLIVLAFITIPITCLMLLFSLDLVSLLLKRGAFDLEAARQTSKTLVCYSLGLFFYAYTFINGAFFAALKKTKVLLQMGIVSIFINVALNFLFMYFLGVMGIALSTSVTMGIISLWFIFLLKKNLGITSLTGIISSLARIMLGAAGMLMVGWGLVTLGEFALVPRLICVIATSVISALCYLGIIWILRTEDLHTCVTILSNRLILGKGQKAS